MLWEQLIAAGGRVALVSATHQHVSGAADDVIVGDDVAVGIPHKPCRRGRRAGQAGGAGRQAGRAGLVR